MGVPGELGSVDRLGRQMMPASDARPSKHGTVGESTRGGVSAARQRAAPSVLSNGGCGNGLAHLDHALMKARVRPSMHVTDYDSDLDVGSRRKSRGAKGHWKA
jgi:hypothetical protein